MIKHSAPIAMVEREVAEARIAALTEYQATRANLRRRVGSIGFIGGLLFGAVAVGYLALGLDRSKRSVYPKNPGVWSRVGETVQVLLPLLMAFNSAAKAAHRSRAKIGGTAG